MTPLRTSRGLLVIAALLWAIACGGTDDGSEAGFPSRDWSGDYALGVVESSTDCLNAEAPPPLGDLALEVRQSIDNHVTVMIGPLVTLAGRLDGDELTAGGEISQPIPLPDSMVARTTPSDSLETIVYRLEATFTGDSLRGRYAIRAPDLVALARDTGKRRCSYEYAIRGTPLTGRSRQEAPPPAGVPAGPR